MGLAQKKHMNSYTNKFQTIFGVDKRCLALFRLGLGLIGMWDVIDRWPDVYAHYSDDGFLPRITVLEQFSNQYWFSFHMMNGTVTFIQILFVINFIISACVAVGYKSRVMMLLHYLFVISIQARNNVVGYGGDVYFRVMCFFGLFLPVGACWSFDSAFKRPVLRRTIKKYNVTNLASFAILLQVAFLYCFSYVHKTGDEWRVDRTATFLALNLDFFRTWIADIFLLFPGFLKMLTGSVLYYEGFGILLAYSPVFTGPLKTLCAIGFLGLHIGFAMCMRLGLFSPICVCGAILLIPTWTWDRLFERLRSKERCDFHLYYNGKYGYTIAGLVSTFLLLPDAEVSPAPLRYDEESGVQQLNMSQSQGKDVGEHIPHSNWIVCRDHKGIKHTGYKAFTAILRASPLLFPFVRVAEMRVVQANGKKVLDLFGRLAVKINESVLVSKPTPNSMFMEETHSMLDNIGEAPDQAAAQPRLDYNGVPDEATTHYFRRLNRRHRLIKKTRNILFNVSAISFIMICLVFNLSNVNTGYTIYVPPKYQWVMFMLRIDQHWSMFSPRPPSIHWWYTIEGELDNGQLTELWANEGMYKLSDPKWKGNLAPYSIEKPDPYVPCIGNHRWFKLYETYNGGNNYEQIRMALGKYICREWNRSHEYNERLWRFSIVYRNERQNMDSTRTPQKELMLWNHVCYDRPVRV
ncbi:hypothetical protein SAMD00019534_009620 [Acytostelium subglobosum LB1]|uniref:hypothetical protein n=1 Tax=Acytostelium subglobosum LB1 TaxID=1410327 RepID=UPI000644B4A9|nr:hypothetical protein SAMD00019534_009620 [Acytostelium subglobosum LB1]GAM17787.1 hypothetical protein SAMD00019534_009620 [Acytostelium subglobosum LB1]|eukprot:XP_012758383.1 hypothetical protein SAMD00019534_009620 [Acytostelium subglobosum LB1]